RGAQTTQGHCGSIQFGLAVNRGRLYSASGYYVGGYPAQLGGRVSPSGDLQANAVAGPRRAHVAGRLRRVQGGGGLGGWRVVRGLLRHLERRSLKANVLTMAASDGIQHSVNASTVASNGAMIEGTLQSRLVAPTGHECRAPAGTGRGPHSRHSRSSRRNIRSSTMVRHTSRANAIGSMKVEIHEPSAMPLVIAARAGTALAFCVVALLIIERENAAT